MLYKREPRSFTNILLFLDESQYGRVTQTYVVSTIQCPDLYSWDRAHLVSKAHSKSHEHSKRVSDTLHLQLHHSSKQIPDALFRVQLKHCHRSNADFFLAILNRIYSMHRKHLSSEILTPSLMFTMPLGIPVGV